VRRVIQVLCLGFAAAALACCASPTPHPAPGGSLCSESRDRLNEPGAVIVRMENNPALPEFIASRVYAPREIVAKVGQVVQFTSADPDEQHTAELNNGACGTDYLHYNESDDLVFKVPGTYPFYCLVHGTTMAGTITIVR